MQENLFVYDTLKFQETQIRIIGRPVSGTPDVLTGFKISKIAIDGLSYHIAERDEKSEIEGIKITVSSEELKKIDEYETSAYLRTRAILKSGTVAWVYHK
ncbi:gamma-glutamylcyclotransferase [Candidatus Woesearchaeota archaeon]|nr:gamma-glutamylcyclotransferase [Candidatus Woesearchaeota archaeon]